MALNAKKQREAAKKLQYLVPIILFRFFAVSLTNAEEFIRISSAL